MWGWSRYTRARDGLAVRADDLGQILVGEIDLALLFEAWLAIVGYGRRTSLRP